MSSFQRFHITREELLSGCYKVSFMRRCPYLRGSFIGGSNVFILGFVGIHRELWSGQQWQSEAVPQCGQNQEDPGPATVSPWKRGNVSTMVYCWGGQFDIAAAWGVGQVWSQHEDSEGSVWGWPKGRRAIELLTSLPPSFTFLLIPPPPVPPLSLIFHSILSCFCTSTHSAIAVSPMWQLPPTWRTTSRFLS